MESLTIKMPNQIIQKAAKRSVKIGSGSRVNDAFKKVAIMIALSIDPEEGHFVIKSNNGHGKKLLWSMKHRLDCPRNARVESLQEDEILITFHGTCTCDKLNKSEFIKKVIQDKLNYVKTWQKPENWIPESMFEGQPQVYCVFTFEETSETETTQTEGEFGLEVGGEGNSTLQSIKNFFVKFLYKRPTTTTITKVTKKFKIN